MTKRDVETTYRRQVHEDLDQSKKKKKNMKKTKKKKKKKKKT